MFIDDYLLDQCKFLKAYQNKFPIKYNKDSNKCAVIIEPRKHELLEAVCRNVMYFLPSDWNLVVCANDAEYIADILKGIDYAFIHLKYTNLIPEEHSALMMYEKFWDLIPGEHVLIFQTDSYLCKPLTNEYLESILKYPYIGGIYQFHKVNEKDIYEHLDKNKLEFRQKPKFLGGNVSNIYKKELELCNTINYNFSINGGFSLRSKKAMLDCIKSISKDNIIEARKKVGLDCSYFELKDIIGEDTFYHNALDILGYELPDKDKCLEFCTNLPYMDKYTYTSYSVHGFNKFFNDKGRVCLMRPSLDTFYLDIKKKFE